MQDEFQNQQFTTRRLTKEDWQAYKDFCSRFFGPDAFKGFLGGKDIEHPQNWRDFIQNSGYTMFGLFKGDTIIGTSSILLNKSEAVFTGIMVEKGYQGRNLSAPLHDVRRRYIDDIGFTGPVRTSILDTNTPSLRAATKNGFEIEMVSFDGGEGWEATYFGLRLER